jgi:release factor glutamine methyltransferase
MLDARGDSVKVERHAGTVGALVRELTAILAAASIADAKREAGDIVAAVRDVPRFWARLHEDETASAELAEHCRRAAQHRSSGAPFAYAVGRSAFRNLTLHVDERVLIPRQETELLVDEVLAREPTGLAIDIGTGSGAIALALAREGTVARVIATDVSLDALAVARTNVARCAGVLRTPVELRHGSLLGPVPERGLRAVVSNPPYISLDEAAGLPAGVRDWEPSVALFSGQAGMATIAGLIRDAAHALAPGGMLAVEVDARRASLAAELAASHGGYESIQVELDLTGRERFVVARRREEE